MKFARRAGLALLVLGSVGLTGTALANGTDAGVQINNRATVSYSVGSVPQTSIESSPTGNSNPGAGNGADTQFLVDRRVFMSVTDIAPASGTVPGATGVVRAFTVSNTSNATVGFSLAGANLAVGDQFDVSSLQVFVDSAIQPNATYTAGSYASGTDTATSILALPEDSSVTVFIVANIPNTVVNTNTALVSLTATATEPTGSTFGTPGAVITATAGANTAAVDTVLGDTGNDGLESDTNIYTISTATLSVMKTLSVISDPFNGTGTDRKAIPGAVIEYAIAIANNGGADADTVGLTDPVPANTTFATGGYSGQDIQITVGAGAPTTCTAAPDTDGCVLAAGVLTVAGANRPTIPAGQTATVRFRVTIQ